MPAQGQPAGPLAGTLVVVRGGGDIGTGVAHRLHAAGLAVLVAELSQPLVVRRTVAFAKAVYAGEVTVEGVTARLVAGPAETWPVAGAGAVPVLVDPAGECLRALRPPIVVDARLAKRNLGTTRADAPLVIALGPGFTAGHDCHAVVETQRGHHLGRVYWQGSAAADTGQPEAVHGHAADRVLRAPQPGAVLARKAIGDAVSAGEVVATAGGAPIVAPFAGVLRGLVQSGLVVPAGMKVGDVDPRGVREHCFAISDKARAVGGGVLEAVLAGLARGLWVAGIGAP
jgi:xanthine dehydrogenase accessory factor